MELDNLINDKKIVEAINSNNKDDLRDLILGAVRYLRKEYSVKFNNFYYAKHVYLSDELFDMFCSSGLKEIFNLFGYNTELIQCKDLDEEITERLGIKNNLSEIDYDLCVGALKIFNDKIEVYICGRINARQLNVYIC